MTVRVSGVRPVAKLVHRLGQLIAAFLLTIWTILTILTCEIVLVKRDARTVRVTQWFGRESRWERRESRHAVLVRDVVCRGESEEEGFVILVKI